MHQVFQAAIELGSALEAGGFEYCFIGGLAVQRWGEARNTKLERLEQMMRKREVL